MPVIIDVEKEQDIGVAKRDLESGVPLILSEEQQGEVVMTSYISMNQNKADWQPQGEWLEEVTCDLTSGTRRLPRLLLKTEGNSRPVGIDDGLIIGLRGTMSRVVGIVPRLPPMSEQQVDEYLDSNPGEDVEMFQEWQFRVSYVKKTDGPEGRYDLTRSEEKKRIESQADMFAAFAELFKMGFAAQQGQAISPNAQALLNAGLAKAAEEAKTKEK